MDPVEAFRILPYRVIAKGDHLIIDTTILAAEGPQTSTGLPQSTDNVTANIRIAIPARGSVVSTFYVKEDRVTELNGLDSSGRNSVIRDFRSGNEYDGPAGKLVDSERPMVVAGLSMGITAIDTVNNIITLDKRDNFVPIRGRYPFVDGPIDSADLPLGPINVPTVRPLRSGDVLAQDLLVNMPNGSIEQVTVRAEILQNMDIGAVVGEPIPIGRIANAPAGEEQGQMLPVARVRVAYLEGGRDSLGREHAFEAAGGAGYDCVMRALYYENVPFGNGVDVVSDAGWRQRFLLVEPEPPQGVTPGTRLDPLSSIAIEFTKPLDVEHIDNTSNLLLTNTSILVEPFTEQLGDPKLATARVVPARLSDVGGDGMLIRLQPPMGLFHRNGQAEVYAFHVRLGAEGVLDLAGNAIELYDDPTNPLPSWSVDLTLEPTALDNMIAWHAWLFNDADEDGSLPGSVDMFGQFRLQDGRLLAASGVHFSRDADSQNNLSTVSRILRGECWDPGFDPSQAGLGPMSPQGYPADARRQHRRAPPRAALLEPALLRPGVPAGRAAGLRVLDEPPAGRRPRDRADEPARVALADALHRGRLHARLPPGGRVRPRRRPALLVAVQRRHGPLRLLRPVLDGALALEPAARHLLRGRPGRQRGDSARAAGVCVSLRAPRRRVVAGVQRERARGHRAGAGLRGHRLRDQPERGVPLELQRQVRPRSRGSTAATPGATRAS